MNDHQKLGDIFFPKNQKIDLSLKMRGNLFQQGMNYRS